MATATGLVAQQLKRAFGEGPAHSRSAFRLLFADKVDLRHVPPLDSDGVVSGKSLADGIDREAAAIGTALSDQRYEHVMVTVEGDVVTVRAELLGCLANGNFVHLPVQSRCTIKGERIVGLEQILDGDAMKAWTEVAVAGGLARNLTQSSD
jgi:hypothetical protein